MNKLGHGLALLGLVVVLSGGMAWAGAEDAADRAGMRHMGLTSAATNGSVDINMDAPTDGRDNPHVRNKSNQQPNRAKRERMRFPLCSNGQDDMLSPLLDLMGLIDIRPAC